MIAARSGTCSIGFVGASNSTSFVSSCANAALDRRQVVHAQHRELIPRASAETAGRPRDSAGTTRRRSRRDRRPRDCPAARARSRPCRSPRRSRRRDPAARRRAARARASSGSSRACSRSRAPSPRRVSDVCDRRIRELHGPIARATRRRRCRRGSLTSGGCVTRVCFFMAAPRERLELVERLAQSRRPGPRRPRDRPTGARGRP